MHTISKNRPVVFVEDLQIRTMPNSAAGTLNVPGRNVRPQKKLSTTWGWFGFRRQLECKLA